MTGIIKDPAEDLDYGYNWAPWLGTDTIVTSTWAISGPDSVLTKHSATNDTTTTTVWLAAGSVGAYTVTNHVITTAGREGERSFTVRVENR